MEKDARLFTEALAVVRRDDQPGRFKDATALQFVDQPAQLLVQIRDAVVIGVALERDLPRRRAWTCPRSSSSR